MAMIQCQTSDDVMRVISEKGIAFIDFKFSDPFGQWQHLTIPTHEFGLHSFENGIPFDGSSIRGWKGIQESDMLLIPDPKTAFIDPFIKEPTLSLICDVVDPITKEPYSRDTRQIAKKALEFLRSTGIGDIAYFGPEAEFFIFDDIRFSSGPNHANYQVDSEEAWWNTAREENPNLGYKIPYKRGYFPVSPLDKTHHIRMDMVKTLEEVGITVEREHHEVATAGQGEINFRFSDIIGSGDNILKYKYVLRNVGYRYGKFVTFMPKPLAGDNGSGMHCHFSIWNNGQNLFAGNGYGGLSEIALYAIGGIIKHARAICAFSNPTTNSYHRLVPGFEAPVRLAYSARNRSAAIRIPVGEASPKAKRIEVRFPDASSNPYLTFTALLMAAIDGIENKIHPGEPLDKDIYSLPPEELANVPQTPGSLQEAIDALKEDNEFLLKGGVMDIDFINMWIETKQVEQDVIRLVPHPKEFELYFDV